MAPFFVHDVVALNSYSVIANFCILIRVSFLTENETRMRQAFTYSTTQEFQMVEFIKVIYCSSLKDSGTIIA